MNRVFEFLRFIIVGVLNTVLDASILNLLLLTTRNQELPYYAFFKTVSFTIAVIFSYFMNKNFVFKKQGGFKVFVFISIIGALLNVSSATMADKTCLRLLGQHLFILCANISLVAGSMVTIAWNFWGYKFIVFKK